MSLLVSAHAWAADRAYYSTGDSVAIRSGSSRVTLGTKAQAGALALTATISAPSVVSLGVLGPKTTVRFALSGEAPAGYRAGVLVSTQNSGLLSLSALESVELRTYLGGKFRESQPIDAAVLKLALLAAAGQPRQLEFTTTMSFDRVEITFDPGLLSVGLLSNITTNILYAYGIAPGVPKLVTGYLSQFANSNGQYSTANGASLPITVCANNLVGDPQLAADNDLTNYAYFNTTAGVGCTSILQVNLAGKVPASGYRAGFVVGSAGLLDVGLLNGLRLRTYLGGVPQEEAGTTSLLNVKLLADGLAFVNFPTTKEFDGVSIERGATVSLLNNLRLYFGFGLSEAAFTTTPIQTSFALSAGRFTNTQGGVACVGCPTNVETPTTGDPYIKLNQGVAVVGTNQVRFELTGPGLVSNRAGIVLGDNTLINLDALKNIVVATYDATGNVLETATTSTLLTLGVLPDNRREISFRTTRNFAQVGITISSALGVSTDVRVYSAFADDGGLLQLIAPPTPLPVVLTSFAVTRAAGAAAADVAWATASEQRSAYFLVERTTDPQAGFTAIGKVAAAGTSTASHQYSLRDAAAPTRVTSYYRLRQVDIDGTETLSPVVALAASASGGEGFALYPNPAPAGTVSLSLGTTAAEGTTVVIYSTVGQVLRRQAVSASGEQPAPTLSTEGLPTGVYHVVLRDAGGHPLGTQRLVIAN
ncbi:MAG: T9SS type A sorting domain-containing protein [Janthinobacterium lividum]